LKAQRLIIKNVGVFVVENTKLTDAGGIEGKD
jgi:hypothetical protein